MIGKALLECMAYIDDKLIEEALNPPCIPHEKNLDEKNNKFENYVKKCDDCYLLVILQDSSKGSFCFYTDSLLKHKYISKFKEVFFYDEKKKQAYKLCTQ